MEAAEFEAGLAKVDENLRRLGFVVTEDRVPMTEGVAALVPWMAAKGILPGGLVG